MARPKTIAPEGTTRHLSVRVSDRLAALLRAEAEATGRSVGAVIRDRLEAMTEREGKAS
jgi:hypothetical protein